MQVSLVLIFFSAETEQENRSTPETNPQSTKAFIFFNKTPSSSLYDSTPLHWQPITFKKKKNHPPLALNFTLLFGAFGGG